MFLPVSVLLLLSLLAGIALVISSVRSSKGIKNSARFYLGSLLSTVPIVHLLFLLGDGVMLESKVDGDYYIVEDRRDIILSLYDDGTFKTVGIDAVFPAGTGDWTFNDYDWYEVELKYYGVNTKYTFWVEVEDKGIELTYDPFSDAKLVLIK